MTDEEKYVVEPLCDWLSAQEAHWEIELPQYETSSNGWDIQARRKNMDLLIEAKYMKRSSASALSGLVLAPLVNRPQKFMKRKEKSWCYYVYWAIGVPDNDNRNDLPPLISVQSIPHTVDRFLGGRSVRTTITCGESAIDWPALASVASTCILTCPGFSEVLVSK